MYGPKAEVGTNGLRRRLPSGLVVIDLGLIEVPGKIASLAHGAPSAVDEDVRCAGLFDCRAGRAVVACVRFSTFLPGGGHAWAPSRNRAGYRCRPTEVDRRRSGARPCR